MGRDTHLEESQRKAKGTELSAPTTGSYQYQLFKHPENAKSHQQQLSTVHKHCNGLLIPCGKTTLWTEIRNWCDETYSNKLLISTRRCRLWKILAILDGEKILVVQLQILSVEAS